MEENNKSRILVTGAAGLIGNAVCKLLKKQQQPFVALYRICPSLDPEWEFVFCDIAECNLQEILKSYNISAIVHCAAAIPNKKNTFLDCYQINSVIDRNVVEYLVSNAVPNLIYISTTNLYGLSNKEITESSEVNIENMYSKSKSESENMFFQINSTNVVSLRVNAPYHYTQTSDTVLKIFINKALAGEDILYHGTGRRQQDFTHVTDVAAAILCALSEKEKIYGIYNIASGNPISMKNLATLILSKVPHSKTKILPSGLPDVQENHMAYFNISKAKNNLEWAPVMTLDTGINEWIKYLQQ